MPRLLRKIRKAKWYKNSGVGWLAPGELQADALGDLSTRDNALSVWYIEENDSNLDRIVTALAGGVDFLANLDYAVFEIALPERVGIKITETRGNSPDIAANAKWHRDLIELSASQLHNLADLILSEAKKVRVPQSRTTEMLAQAMASGQVDRSKVKPTLLEQLEPD